MKSYEEILELREPLEEDYSDRHNAHRKLRHFWHGRYWENIEVESGGVSSIFSDLTARSSDVGPDIKLVYNVLKDVCVKYQSFLAPLPMIRVYVDPPSSPTRRNQATIKERYLYGTWNANKMNKVLSDKGWFLPLMGDCFFGIWPDFKNNICRTIIRSPEYAYPIPSFDMEGLDGVIFAWRARESAVKRMFPEYEPKGRNSGRFPFSPRRPPRASDPEIEIMEYSDKGEFDRFAGSQKLNGVDHEMGFNLFDHIKFINVPGEVWGHGAVEQAVNLVEMGNAYLSLMMQSAIENVFPVMVMEDPMKMPEQIQRGAGAVIPVNAGGKVYYLAPPSGNMIAQAGWAQEMERMIKTDTSMPDVNFGQFQASIVTGKAINELQGAGTGTLVEMVQGIGIGAGLVSWNEKAIHIARTMFRDDKIHLFGHETPSIAQLNPRHFSLTLKGSQLVGSSRNEVVFMPHLDQHSKVVMGLQMAGAGLVSRQWQREQVGIPDSEAMDEEIVGEAIQDAVLGFLLQSITDPSMAEQVETSAFDYIEGKGSAPPILGISGPAIPTGGAPPQMGQAQLPAAMPVPGQTPESQSTGVPLDQAVSAIQSIQGLEGRVFLIGEIVVRGVAEDEVEVAVTVPADRQKIAAGVPFQVVFRVVESQPNEQFIEVTPGANPIVQGEEPAPEELLALA